MKNNYALFFIILVPVIVQTSEKTKPRLNDPYGFRVLPAYSVATQTVGRDVLPTKRRLPSQYLEKLSKELSSCRAELERLTIERSRWLRHIPKRRNNVGETDDIDFETYFRRHEEELAYAQSQLFQLNRDQEIKDRKLEELKLKREEIVDLENELKKALQSRNDMKRRNCQLKKDNEALRRCNQELSEALVSANQHNRLLIFKCNVSLIALLVAQLERRGFLNFESSSNQRPRIT